MDQFKLLTAYAKVIIQICLEVALTKLIYHHAPIRNMLIVMWSLLFVILVMWHVFIVQDLEIMFINMDAVVILIKITLKMQTV